MRTAVTIPDELFKKVERLARRARKSRSEVVSSALTEYVARRASDEVTDAMNRVCADVGAHADVFVSAAARHVLDNTEGMSPPRHTLKDLVAKITPGNRPNETD